VGLCCDVGIGCNRLSTVIDNELVCYDKFSCAVLRYSMRIRHRTMQVPIHINRRYLYTLDNIATNNDPLFETCITRCFCLKHVLYVIHTLLKIKLIHCFLASRPIGLNQKYGRENSGRRSFDWRKRTQTHYDRSFWVQNSD
jgi:hypothetical protein